MKLCFSTVSSILCECSSRRGQKHEICRQLLLAFPPYDTVGIDNALTTRLRKGERNVPITAVDPSLHWDRKDIQDRIIRNVLPLLEGSTHTLIVKALQTMAGLDEEISGSTIIDLYDNMTKEALLRRTNFVFTDLLVGILMYVLKYTDNQNTQASASEIDTGFLDSCRGDCHSIALVNSYADIEKLTRQDVALSADDTVLFAESKGKCLLCGRPVGIREGAKSINRAQIVALPSGARILTCADCSSKIKSLSADELDRLEQEQSNNRALAEAEDMLATDRLESDIEAVLLEIDGLEDSQSLTLRHDPVCVDNKVQDRRLRGRINSDVLRLYDGIDDIMDRLSGISAINADRLGRQINRMYEDAEQSGLSEYRIYQIISERLDAHTGRKYPEACNAIVSYYVQRCDVFHAVTQ